MLDGRQCTDNTIFVKAVTPVGTTEEITIIVNFLMSCLRKHGLLRDHRMIVLNPLDNLIATNLAGVVQGNAVLLSLLGAVAVTVAIVAIVVSQIDMEITPIDME